MLTIVFYMSMTFIMDYHGEQCSVHISATDITLGVLD